ncbi:hypothetical protein PABG_12235 [Paracoccidioides brasiliensis Pb03]|uniref:Cupin 2 conserved barrel domain-containing protein n=1 Tax=Paracoccidioides brasiliensis (strain Pb18) TaxID=502780 RepID=C1GHS1_PARBD|nr:uncharacterized protein PADG_06807 [Paracoccidioides brasiliensis Pb18]EEH50728.1 hypothetical protein PADG_06807 [Paracoccidioides brasiliensis Pb18]KGY14844.1 hypothetical protein PABG_12235 [Paracoccidioides brasiliensis Pb03]ODH53222.1 hypothetical protein GX48_00418 [Paracoccidioides brasiliensis]
MSTQPAQRYITTHNSTGASVFDTTIPTTVPEIEFPGGQATLTVDYATEGFPTSLSDNRDIEIYKKHLATPPGIVLENGTVMRRVALKPGWTSPMYRTMSIDIGVIVDGSVELVLDSGESRLLNRGDVFVQRATMHKWRNASSTEPVTILGFIQPCAPLEVAGKLLEEEHPA